jgi:hypothetical protein
MKFPPWLTVYGDQSYRGRCPVETSEQISLFAWLDWNHKDLAEITLHPKIEGKRTWQQVQAEKKMGGINKGASDIIIPGGPSLVLELKRKDHTQSSWRAGQKEYLLGAKNNGAIVCVALGFEAATEAINHYIKIINKKR